MIKTPAIGLFIGIGDVGVGKTSETMQRFTNNFPLLIIMNCFTPDEFHFVIGSGEA